jgi:hypothetical protein
MNATETANYADIIRDMGYIPELRSKHRYKRKATLDRTITTTITHIYVIVLLPPDRSYRCSLGRLEAVSAMNEDELRALVKKRLGG